MRAPRKSANLTFDLLAMWSSKHLYIKVFVLITCFQSLSGLKRPLKLDGRLRVELVSLGTIAPSSTTSLVFIAPAMEEALEEIHNGIYGRHLSMTLTFLFNKTIYDGNDVPYYSDQMMANWYYQDRSRLVDVSVIIIPGGPEDISINRLAANWDVLFVTCGSIKFATRNKAISPTWVATTVYSSPDAARLYMKICDLYNWTTVFLVHDRQSSPVYYAAAGAVTDLFTGSSRYQFTATTINGTGYKECASVLSLFATTGRVLLFFGHAAPFRHFMLAASHMNMTNKDYVYIVLEPFHHNIIGNFTWRNNDANDSVALLAFQSVLLLMIEIDRQESPEIKYLEAEWKKGSKVQFNYTYAPGEMFLPHVAEARHSMLILAQILNESLSTVSFNYSDGKALARMMSNRTFTENSEEIVIDRYGQRKTNWSLSFVDNQTSTFQAFLWQDAKLQQLIQITEPQWYGGKVMPANEPLCGYRGTRPICQKVISFASTYSITFSVLGVGLLVSIFAGLFMRYRLTSFGDSVWWLLDDTRIGCALPQHAQEPKNSQF